MKKLFTLTAVFTLRASALHANLLPEAVLQAVKQGLTTSALDDESVFCSKDGVCFLFLTCGKEAASFLGRPQLRAISDVRQGRARSLHANATFTDLINRIEPNSRVFRVAPEAKYDSGLAIALQSSLVAVGSDEDVCKHQHLCLEG
jgi:hypothetical protein